MNRLKIVLFLLIVNIIFANTHKAYAYEELVVPASNEVDIIIDRFPSTGNYLILWLAPEYGFRSTHRSFAQRLNEQKIEVWQTNIAESLFLPQGTASLRQLDGSYTAEVIEYAHKITNKKIIVAGDSYASINALLGAHRWQQSKHSTPYLIGAVLFSPYTYAYVPPLGLEPEFMPVISSTNIPIMIYQAKNSGNINQFNTLLKKLQQHDNPVYTKFIPDIMSLFYKDPPSNETLKNTVKLPKNIKSMIGILEKHKLPDTPIKLGQLKSKNSGRDFHLKQFSGDHSPVSIHLKDIYGNTTVKNHFKGQVTMINFWATWCPPCVEEIPSLNRLKKAMKDEAFEIISINYAEDKKVIVDFMKKVNVEFPVLLDHNGAFAKDWNVVSYPSTFIIDTSGKIRYGVNSAIEWDQPEIIKTIKSLYIPTE